MTKSVLSNERECFRCKTTLNLQKHHIFNSAYRNKSDRMGYWVYLCMDCHTGARGVHTTTQGRIYWDYLKGLCQQHYEQDHSREDFIREFGRNYL